MDQLLRGPVSCLDRSELADQGTTIRCWRYLSVLRRPYRIRTCSTRSIIWRIPSRSSSRIMNVVPKLFRSILPPYVAATAGRSWLPRVALDVPSAQITYCESDHFRRQHLPPHYRHPQTGQLQKIRNSRSLEPSIPIDGGSMAVLIIIIVILVVIIGGAVLVYNSVVSAKNKVDEGGPRSASSSNGATISSRIWSPQSRATHPTRAARSKR